MLKYLIKRVLWMIPMLIGISLISFFIMHLAPGDITSNEAAFNPKASEESRQKLREMYNLDKPVIVQYSLWLKRMATLDFGNSFASNQTPVFWEKADKYGNVWLSLLLMYWLGVVNNWLPISGIHSLNYETLSTWGRIKDTLSHLMMPVIIPSVTGLAGITLFIKNGMLDVLQQDYITTARAKGLNEHRVIYTHALRNALLPLITIVGLSIPGLIGGSVIAETIFAIPGMGKLFYDAVLMRDFPVVMGVLTIGAALTLIGNLLADIAYAWADPRVRRGVAR